MKIKKLKELIEKIPDDVDVYFMFGLNDKYEDNKNGIFTLKENCENSYFENKLIFTLKEDECIDSQKQDEEFERETKEFEEEFEREKARVLRNSLRYWR